MRMPYHIHALPFRKTKSGIEFALFRRSDIGVWQGIVGGGESGESICETVIRESEEEANAVEINRVYHLDTVNFMPAYPMYDEFIDKWGTGVVVIPMYFFAFEYNSKIIISDEHTAFRWAEFHNAIALMQMSDQKVGLWELNYRLQLDLLDREFPEIYLEKLSFDVDAI